MPRRKTPRALPDPLPAGLTVYQAALYCQRDRKTIFNWIRRGIVLATTSGSGGMTLVETASLPKPGYRAKRPRTVQEQVKATVRITTGQPSGLIVDVTIDGHATVEAWMAELKREFPRAMAEAMRKEADRIYADAMRHSRRQSLLYALTEHLVHPGK